MASKRVAGFRLFRGPTWMYMGFGGRGFRHVASAARGVLAIGLVACAFGAGHVAVAQEAVEAPRHVLRLYSGQCNADDPLPQAGAESASPQIVPATPYQAAVFAMEIEGTIASLVAEPASLAVELIDGELTVVEACGDLTQEAGGDRLVVSLLSPVSGALMGVADVTEADPGQIRVQAYLMLESTGGNDIPVDSTDQPEPGDDDGEQPGGV